MTNAGEHCKGCTDRKPGCHDRCQRYQESKAKYLEEKSKINEKRMKENRAKEFAITSRKRIRNEVNHNSVAYIHNRRSHE